MGFETASQKPDPNRRAKVTKLGLVIGAAALAEKFVRRSYNHRHKNDVPTYQKAAMALTSEGYKGLGREQATMIVAITLAAHPVNKNDLLHWLEDSEECTPKRAKAIVSRLTLTKDYPLVREQVVLTDQGQEIVQLVATEASIWAAQPEQAKEYPLLHEYLELLLTPWAESSDNS